MTPLQLVPLFCVTLTAGFSPAPAPCRPARHAARAPPVAMKRWEKRSVRGNLFSASTPRAHGSHLSAFFSCAQTLAETTGGAADGGEASVGLIGDIPVTFSQGNETLKTMAIVGQPLSEVAAQCGQYIKYKCRKGECGTCEVRINGQWTRTCVTKVPHVAQGETFAVHVRGSMIKTAKSSRFYSFKSILAGAKNNLLGMVGFVREGKRSQKNFNHRIDSEKELLAQAKARKAARLAAEQGKKI